jgi:glutathione S-transferase
MHLWLIMMNHFDTLTSRIATSVFRRHAACAVAPRSSPPPKHNLILYDFEASPWCRLVREQLTILDLNAHVRPCPRQDLLLQGAYTRRSRFRPLAAEELPNIPQQDEDDEISLTFPILVDETNGVDNRVVIKESYAIIEHLWKEYGRDVILPSPTRRPDQVVNSSRLPFPLRFLLLSGPSYLRCLPRCGLFRMPCKEFDPDSYFLTLYQAEGCPYSRLVRELLCSLELPYHSITCAEGSFSVVSMEDMEVKNGIPIMVVEQREANKGINMTTRLLGHENAVAFLLDNFWDSTSKQPQWWQRVSPQENSGQSNKLGMSVYLAFLQGRRAFVPKAVKE